jgi:GT2 family glycosyltransferase
MPICNVIIVNWNGRHHLEACLGSLYRQTFRDFDAILVDNGSSDGSQDYVRTEFPWVRLIELEHNLRFCAANNIGVRHSTGKYVALLNNDTETAPDWLAELIAAAEAAPDSGSQASRMLMFSDREVLDSAGNEYAGSGAAAKRGHLSKFNAFLQPAPVFGACAGAALYRRSMLDDIGLFDEAFGMIFEDVDLAFRAQLAGYPCLYVPSAVVYHKVNASIGTLSYDYVYYGQRNIEFVFFKNMPGRLLLRHLPAHVFYNLLAFGFFAFRGRPFAFLKAKLDALLDFRRILQDRRRIQAARRIPEEAVGRLLARYWLARRWAEKGPIRG